MRNNQQHTSRPAGLRVISEGLHGSTGTWPAGLESRPLTDRAARALPSEGVDSMMVNHAHGAASHARPMLSFLSARRCAGFKVAFCGRADITGRDWPIGIKVDNVSDISLPFCIVPDHLPRAGLRLPEQCQRDAKRNRVAGAGVRRPDDHPIIARPKIVPADVLGCRVIPLSHLVICIEVAPAVATTFVPQVLT